MKLRAGLLVPSDRISAGLREDRSGKEAAAALEPIARVEKFEVVPDDQGEIRSRLIEWADGGLDVIFTLGGTGLGPRDVTPEATRSVLERELPALTTALLVHGLAGTCRAMLSRAVAGVRGQCLIVNLPGNPSAVRELIEYLLEVLPHAIEMIHGGDHQHEETHTHKNAGETPA